MAPFPAPEFLFGNLALTKISVWLGAERRVNSPRFDMLAGEAEHGFGLPCDTRKALALALIAAPDARLSNRQPFCFRRIWDTLR